MSISSEITRITNAVANAYTEADAKGAEMPASLTVANLAQTIASISGGGGVVGATGSIKLVSASQVLTIPHNLGKRARFMVVSAGTGNSNTSVAYMCYYGASTGQYNCGAIRSTAVTVKTYTESDGYKSNVNYCYNGLNEITIGRAGSYNYTYVQEYHWAVVV